METPSNSIPSPPYGDSAQPALTRCKISFWNWARMQVSNFSTDRPGVAQVPAGRQIGDRVAEAAHDAHLVRRDDGQAAQQIRREHERGAKEGEAFPVMLAPVHHFAQVEMARQPVVKALEPILPG